jgi:hypothetical protein
MWPLANGAAGVLLPGRATYLTLCATSPGSRPRPGMDSEEGPPFDWSFRREGYPHRVDESLGNGGN